MGIVECLLMLKEGVMHLPELSLGGGSFCGLRRMLGMGVALGQGEVPEDKAQPVAQPSLDLLDDGIGLPTIRALIIAVLYQGYRGGCWSLLMIALAHRHRESGRC